MVNKQYNTIQLSLYRHGGRYLGTWWNFMATSLHALGGIQYMTFVICESEQL